MASPLEDVKKFTIGELAALVRNVGGPTNVEAILRVGNIGDAVTKILDDRIGIRIFTCRVNKSDSALKPFNRDEFTDVSSGLESKDYPLQGTGLQARRFKVINLWERFPEGHNPTTQELLDLVKAEGGDPDFADTKAFLRDNPGEAINEHPLVSLCGSVVSRDGGRSVACFFASSDSRFLSWGWLDYQWDRNYRLLVACK